MNHPLFFFSLPVVVFMCFYWFGMGFGFFSFVVCIFAAAIVAGSADHADPDSAPKKPDTFSSYDELDRMFDDPSDNERK